MSVTVLLTAAITPNKGVSVKLDDPSVRLQQYRAAFTWWANSARANGFNLAVVEASGTDVSEFIDSLSNVPRNRLTVISYVPRMAGERGKGALEAELIDHALSVLQLNEDDTVYKVTGRLTINNAAQVFRELPRSSLVARGLLNQTRVDMRCLGATVGVWVSILKGMADDVDERRDIHLGHVVACRIMTGRVSGSLSRRLFNDRPQIRGVSGTFGKKYGTPMRRISETFGRRAEKLLVQLAEKKSV